MKRKFAFLLALVLICASFPGCGKKESEATEPVLPEFTTVPTEAETVPTEPAETLPEVQPDPGANFTESNDLLDFANFSAVVDTSSETGCVVLPDLKTINDSPGDTYAGGSYDPDQCDESYLRVKIEYNPGCIFQSAEISMWTHNITYQTVTAADIQRNVHVIVFGEYDIEGVLHADRVYLDTMLM